MKLVRWRSPRAGSLVSLEGSHMQEFMRLLDTFDCEGGVSNRGDVALPSSNPIFRLAPVSRAVGMI